MDQGENGHGRAAGSRSLRTVSEYTDSGAVSYVSLTGSQRLVWRQDFSQMSISRPERLQKMVINEKETKGSALVWNVQSMWSDRTFISRLSIKN